MSVLSLETANGVATLWLDRPDRQNAMALSFFDELPAVVEKIDEDDDVRCVVIAAKGKHFSVGLDLKSEIGMQMQSALAGGLAAERKNMWKMIHRMQRGFRALAQSPKPVIAAIHGACIGGGLDLISACDIRYASEDAVVSLRETRVAIVADLGSLQRLEGIIGRGFVREMAFTGRDYDSHEAAAMGLFQRVLPDREACLEHAMQVARDIAANSPLAVQGAKQMLVSMSEPAISRGLDTVALWNSAFLPSQDLMEAISAFVQKRPPRFQGK